MPYDKEKKMIYTKLVGVTGANYNPASDNDVYSIYNPDKSEDPLPVSFTYKNDVSLGLKPKEMLSANYQKINSLIMHVNRCSIDEVKNESIKKMSYLLNSFFKRQMVINYIYNHPDRVIRFYRMHNKIYVRFSIYDDINFNETTEWCVNYHIGEIEIQKYQDILDANITGITNFSVTGFEKRMKDSKINLGLNIGIKIYE